MRAQADHTEERRQHVLQLQRRRRAKMRRIDYYAGPEAVAIIDSMRTQRVTGDASSILNRIVAEWAATRDRSAAINFRNFS
jgi:hypothetical protein